jgi:ADP-ribose pyrophosphatase
MEKFKRLERKLIHSGSTIDYFVDTILVPNGNIAKWDHIEHKGAAAIVPITDTGKILMVKQWRNSLNRYTLEIPAGGLNTNEIENSRAAAVRELEEETGHRSDQIDFLISIRTAGAFCNERIDIYTAHHLIPSKQNLDEDEFIEVEEKSLQELKEMIFEGIIQDSKTISAIFAYQEKYMSI